MTYDFYALIMDLAEAGYTVQFKPFFTDDNLMRPAFINVTVRSDDLVSYRHVRPQEIVEAEDGEAALTAEMIDMAKYLIRQEAVAKMKEAEEET